MVGQVAIVTRLCALLALLAVTACATLPAEPAPAAPASVEEGFGYPTPAAALAALRARTDVEFGAERGWTLVRDRPNLTYWTFTPSDHPASPAGIKRVFVQRDGGWYPIMSMRCGGPRPECDRLYQEMTALTARMAEAIRRPPSP